MFDLSAKERFFKVVETRGSRKIVLKHFFRLPSFDDWERYYRGSSEVGLSRGKRTFEFSGAIQERNLVLWEDLITKVEGYVLNGQDIMTFDDWKQKIPEPHKEQAVGGFTRLFRKEDDIEEAAVLDLGSDEIDITITVLTNDSDKVVYADLVFYFETPEASDYKKMSRLTSKMRLTRTKERNVSTISVPTDIKPYVDLFDKLIKRVEGYVYSGQDVMEVADWKKLIDASHKRIAVEELFEIEFEEDEGKA